MEENNNVKYSGFATPSLILEGSDKSDRGYIIDPYAKTEDKGGLICGEWSKGFNDGLIHIYLVKPVAALCDEREGWVDKQTLLKEPISCEVPVGTEVEGTIQQSIREPTPQPKKRLVLDPETKQFRLI